MTNYKQLLPHLSQWRDLLDEVAHGYDTNCNESMNNLTAWIAPKNKCYTAEWVLSEQELLVRWQFKHSNIRIPTFLS